jgi:hypothetical protein
MIMNFRQYPVERVGISEVGWPIDISPALEIFGKISRIEKKIIRY